MSAHPLAFVLMFWFFGVWVGSALVLPVVFILAIQGYYIPVYFMLAYYAFRMVQKPTYKMGLHHFCARVLSKKHYFREQNTIVEEEIQEDSKSLLSVHPHGILCCGWSTTLNMSMELLPLRMHLLVTDAMFKLPFTADMLGWFNLYPATKKQMFQLMKKGKNLALLPGGYQEATLYKRGHHRVFIKDRQGFIKYCLQHGYKVHPCYNFGEEETYMAATSIQEKLMFLNKYKMPAVIFLGKYLGFLPNDDLAMTTVVGKGIEMPLIENPTQDDVEKWHSTYMKELQSLFDRHKGKYASQGNSAQLEVF